MKRKRHPVEAEPEAAGLPVPESKDPQLEYRPNEFLNEQKLCAEMGNTAAPLCGMPWAVWSRRV